MEKRKCNKCSKTKPLDQFYKSNLVRCKECKKEWQSNYHEKVGRSNVRKQRNARTYRERHYDYLKYRDLALQRLYKINRETFVSMCIKQDYKCASCGDKQLDFTDFKTWKKHSHVKNGTSRFSHLSLHVDHSHDTNKIRELLCRSCNQGLGHFKDDPALLKKAIKYLNKHNRRANDVRL